MEKTMDKIVQVAKARGFIRDLRSTVVWQTHGIMEILVWN